MAQHTTNVSYSKRCRKFRWLMKLLLFCAGSPHGIIAQIGQTWNKSYSVIIKNEFIS